MSPIDKETIRVERWTHTSRGRYKKQGDVKTQVIAEGDENDPGTYVYVYGVQERSANKIKPPIIVDVLVDDKTGNIKNIPEVKGKWRRFLPADY